MASRLGNIWYLFPLVLALLCTVDVRCARAERPGRSVLIVLVPDLEAADMVRPELSILPVLVRQGASGWMNIRTARDDAARSSDREALYASLGAGARARVRAPLSRLNPQTMQALQAKNAGLSYPLRIGLLGDTLRAAGVQTCIIGNEDDALPRHAAKLVIADNTGQVDEDRSETTEANRKDLRAPYGLSWRASDFRMPSKGPTVTVWVFGDLARAALYSVLSTPAAARAHRSGALLRLNGVLLAAERLARQGTSVMVLGIPLVESTSRWERLAPALVLGRTVRPGVLTSPSTRTLGLFTATDFLPTIAREAGVARPAGLSGRPVEAAASEAGLKPWLDRYQRWAATARLQAHLGGLPVLQLLLLSAATVLATGMVGLSAKWSQGLARAAAGAVVALPLALLLLPILQLGTLTAAYGALALVLTIAGGYASRATKQAAQVALGCCLLLAVCLVADVMTGQNLLRQAWMSYSLTEGARFYGIGNEYGGCLLAAGLVLTGAAFGPGWRAWVPALVLLLVGLVVALPAAGANLGAGAAICVAACIALIAWRKGRLDAWAGLVVLAILAALVAGLIAFDLLVGRHETSHIGLAAINRDIGNAVVRKAVLNAELLFQSPWSPLLLGAAMALWLITRLLEKTRRQFTVTAASVAGSAALFVLNDSGVIAAACCLSLLAAVSCLTMPVREPILAHSPSAGGRSPIEYDF